MTSVLCGLTFGVSPLLKSFSSLWSVAIAWGKYIDFTSPPISDVSGSKWSSLFLYSSKNNLANILYIVFESIFHDFSYNILNLISKTSKPNTIM